MIGTWELIIIALILLVFALVLGAGIIAACFVLRGMWKQHHPPQASSSPPPQQQ